MEIIVLFIKGGRGDGRGFYQCEDNLYKADNGRAGDGAGAVGRKLFSQKIKNF